MRKNRGPVPIAMRRRAADGSGGPRDVEEGGGALQGLMQSAGGSFAFKIILTITGLVALAMLTVTQSVHQSHRDLPMGAPQDASVRLIPPELGVNTSPGREWMTAVHPHVQLE